MSNWKFIMTKYHTRIEKEKWSSRVSMDYLDNFGSEFFF